MGSQEEHVFVEMRQSGAMGGIVEVSCADVDGGRFAVGVWIGD